MNKKIDLHSDNQTVDLDKFKKMKINRNDFIKEKLRLIAKVYFFFLFFIIL